MQSANYITLDETNTIEVTKQVFEMLDAMIEANEDDSTQEGPQDEEIDFWWYVDNPTHEKTLSFNKRIALSEKWSKTRKRNKARKAADKKRKFNKYVNNFIDSMIQPLKEEILDWQSRVYKTNNYQVRVGGNHASDYESGMTTIGAANERRRQRNIDWRKYEIECFENDRKTLLSLGSFKRVEKKGRKKMESVNIEDFLK